MICLDCRCKVPCLGVWRRLWPHVGRFGNTRVGPCRCHEQGRSLFQKRTLPQPPHLPDQLTRTRTRVRMHHLCDLSLRKAGGRLQGTRLVQSLEKFPAWPPPHLRTLRTRLALCSPLRSPLPGAAFLTEMVSLTRVSLPVPRAQGGVCQGAAGTQ